MCCFRANETPSTLGYSNDLCVLLTFGSGTKRLTIVGGAQLLSHPRYSSEWEQSRQLYFSKEPHTSRMGKIFEKHDTRTDSKAK